MTPRLEERVHQLVHAHRPHLEQLVRAAVDRELQALVDAELASRNGNGAAPSAATKICTECGNRLPVDRFDRNRNQCRACRTRRYARAPRTRTSKTTVNGDGPRTG